MIEMRLSDEEKDVILNLRDETLRKKELEKRYIRVLEIAKNFETWRQELGVGTSFSIFMREFGHNDADGELLWRDVCHVLAAVYKI